MSTHRVRLLLLVLAALPALLPALPAHGETGLGDWGHFLSYKPRMFLQNPDGKEFTVTVGAMRWAIDGWNTDEIHLRVTDPAGEAVVDEPCTLEKSQATVTVPAGLKGTYLLEINPPVQTMGPDGKPRVRQGRSVNVFVRSSLPRSVLYTGTPLEHVRDGHRAVFQASVPRTWTFWVPRGVKTFKVSATRGKDCMSQREDWGYSILSPRGQRVRTLWGQPLHGEPTDGKYGQEQSTWVEVEPGADGKFWTIEVRLGDSHNYSNINFVLEGVPPYIARSPEEWFDPTSGQAPQIDPYVTETYMQAAMDDATRRRWPTLQNFSPCPALGDPDGCEILGDARFALWNPAGRELKLRVGTYLPRGSHSDAPDEAKRPPAARVVAAGSDGAAVLDAETALEHVHGDHAHPNLDLGKVRGVTTVRVTGAERFLAFTYPATPLVLLGEDGEEGWKRFRLSVGTARDWFFYVPRGTQEFSVRAAAQHETDVLHLQICTPDRAVAMLYDTAGERTVKVPAGMDGRIWHVRCDVGSASELRTDADGPPRYLDILMTLELSGVPGYLAPTWEQWFDPESPHSPHGR